MAEIKDSDIFKDFKNNFSTSDPKEWFKHLENVEHEIHINTICSGSCGQRITASIKTKVAAKHKGVPQGLMCDDCKKKIQETKVQVVGAKTK